MIFKVKIFKSCLERKWRERGVERESEKEEMKIFLYNPYIFASIPHERMKEIYSAKLNNLIDLLYNLAKIIDYRRLLISLSHG